ncbi:MAG: acyl carrier protein [Lentisphaeria bacterium]|jgi:acyl carrier protein
MDETFRAHLAELLELDKGRLSPETTLAELEGWDSMARVLFVAMADREYGRRVAGKEVTAARTVADLQRLVQG